MKNCDRKTFQKSVRDEVVRTAQKNEQEPPDAIFVIVVYEDAFYS